MFIDLDRLVGVLNTSGLQNKDSALYQVILQLIKFNQKLSQALDAGTIGGGGSGGIGPIGPQGPVGAPGTIGASGLDGIDGEDGVSIPGSSGPIGPMGPLGPMGIDGLQGEIGDIGFPGVPGPIGPMGPSGAVGLLGPAGMDGNDGTDGTDGAPGVRGIQGIQGLIGPPGLDSIEDFFEQHLPFGNFSGEQQGTFYRTGFFTPNLVCGTSGTITITAPTNTGLWIKIGKVVVISVKIVVTSVSSPVGFLAMQGLPFVVGASSGAIAAYVFNLNSSAPNSAQSAVGAGTSSIFIYGFSAGSLVNLAGFVQAGSELNIGGTYIAAN